MSNSHFVASDIEHYYRKKLEAEQAKVRACIAALATAQSALSAIHPIDRDWEEENALIVIDSTMKFARGDA